jgi:hypothetical protein
MKRSISGIGVKSFIASLSRATSAFQNECAASESALSLPLQFGAGHCRRFLGGKARSGRSDDAFGANSHWYNQSKPLISTIILNLLRYLLSNVGFLLILGVGFL